MSARKRVFALLALSIPAAACAVWLLRAPLARAGCRFFPKTAAVAHAQIGRKRADQGNIDEAFRHLTRALALDADCRGALLGLSEAFLTARQPQRSVQYLSKILAKDPKDAQARFGLGVALDALDLPEDALAQYAQVLALKPRNPEARYNYGLDLLRLDRPEQALEHLRLAAQLQPIPQVFNNLGAAFAATGDLRSAQECFLRALSMDPGNIEAKENLRRLPRKSS
ncbi:MAG: tetratricopeptide repeat protein [Elusimicrobiota bacterium]|jgi:tetratricopeptide (TPR) repeat protein